LSFGIWVGSINGKEHSDDCFTAVRGGVAKRRASVVVLRVGIDLACGESFQLFRSLLALGDMIIKNGKSFPAVS
jgi:hypothetical protein